ncbi:MAG: alpha/beta hydrolase [Rhodospirillaceae bacterium]
MPVVTTRDGIALDVLIEGDHEETILFLHEFAGDARSWATQMAYLSGRFRCIAFNARGYPPSEVPVEAEFYSQQKLVDEAFDVLDAFGVQIASVVGLSMGSYTALHMGLQAPNRIKSVIAAGIGWGSDPAQKEENLSVIEKNVGMFQEKSMRESAALYADYPMRQRFKEKDPRGWKKFRKELEHHSPLGSAMTMRNVQGRRPTLPEMEDSLKKFQPPLLVLVGDEDLACIEGSLLLKKIVPDCGLAIFPWSSHTLNLEEPDAFNEAIAGFLDYVE